MSAKKKKIYAMVLLVGLAALLVNQLLGSEPAPAAAAPGTASERPAADSATAATDAAPLTGRVAAAPFPRDLPGPEAIDSLRDAFVLTPAAHKAVLGNTDLSDSRTGRRAARLSVAAEFEESHQLLAVMTAPDTRVAIVDEQWVQVGQTVDGCRLLEIMGQTALFQCVDGRVLLTVPTLGEGTKDR